MRTLFLILITGGLYLLILPFRRRAQTRGHKLHDLVLVRLTSEQIARAKAENGPRRRITHALICGPFGQRFGTDSQCRKYFDAWNPANEQPIFPGLFKRAVELDDYAITDFSSTDELVMRLIEAQDRRPGNMAR